MERIGNGSKTNAIDTARFGLSAPSDGNYQKSVEISNAHIEYQKSRLATLEVANKFGNDQWKAHNYEMESLLSALKRKGEELDDRKTKVNRIRMQDQLHTQKTLDSLSFKANELIVEIASVKLAVDHLRTEIRQ